VTAVDEAVLAAVAKWPDVPAVFGWLKLTARGEWRIRGERVQNPALRAFIGRNYGVDSRGRWFFQNGPQRVFVELEVAPWVYRIAPGERLATHTGVPPVALSSAALLDDGRFLLVTDLGAGLVDDRDAALFLRAVTDFAGLPLNERGLERWFEGKDEAFVDAARLELDSPACRIQRLRTSDIASRFGFVRVPAE
jgi:hypothetical protein